MLLVTSLHIDVTKHGNSNFLSFFLKNGTAFSVQYVCVEDHVREHVVFTVTL